MSMSRIPRKKKKKIPKDTFYCYTRISDNINTENELSYYMIKKCPFYKSEDSLTGYCRLLKCEIIDKVKECEVSIKK